VQDAGGVAACVIPGGVVHLHYTSPLTLHGRLHVGVVVVVVMACPKTLCDTIDLVQVDTYS
jgi:hypothetical protein